MRVFNTLEEVRDRNPEVAFLLVSRIYDYCLDAKLDPLHEPTDYLFGGKVIFLDSIREAIEEFGQMPIHPDILKEILPRVYEVVFITNNSGGNVYILSESNLMGYIQTIPQNDQAAWSEIAADQR